MTHPPCTPHGPAGCSGSPGAQALTFELIKGETKAQVAQQAGNRKLVTATFTEPLLWPTCGGDSRSLQTRASPGERVYQGPLPGRSFGSLPASAWRGSVSEWDGSRITERSSVSISSIASCPFHPFSKIPTHQSCAKDQAKAGDATRKSLFACLPQRCSQFTVGQVSKSTRAVLACTVNTVDSVEREFFPWRLSEGGLTGTEALLGKLEG